MRRAGLPSEGIAFLRSGLARLNIPALADPVFKGIAVLREAVARGLATGGKPAGVCADRGTYAMAAIA